MDSRALVHNVIAAVDVKRFASNEPSGVVRKECRGNADIIDADKAPGRGLFLRLFEQLVELGDSRGGARGKRSRRDRVNTDSLWPQLGCYVAHSAFEGRLGNAHDVVVLH